MFRETESAPEQLCRRPANCPGRDLCRELTSELLAVVATAIPAKTRLPEAERLDVLPLAISCFQGLAGNRWEHPRDPPELARLMTHAQFPNQSALAIPGKIRA